jgi:hypothetical protein
MYRGNEERLLYLGFQEVYNKDDSKSSFQKKNFEKTGMLNPRKPLTIYNCPSFSVVWGCIVMFAKVLTMYHS